LKRRQRERKAMELICCRYKKTKAMKEVSTKQEERKTHKGKGLVIRQRHTLFQLFVYIVFVKFYTMCKIT